jgi:trk system potassium uptake protein TrkH
LHTITLSLVCALALILCTRGANPHFYAREGFVAVALGWLVLSAAGALPFFFSREIPHYVDALFETISGFTTTGASILSNVEALSRGMLYWRSFTNWLGGMGMLVFLLAVVPGVRGSSGNTMHLLRAESPGPSVGKLVPKMRQTAKILYGIYIALTLLCVLFLLAGSMPLFDALCISFSTAGTGGFAILNDSIASYSPYVQNVVTVFMALFGVNFGIYFLLLLGEWRTALLDEELRLYAGLMAASILLITANVLSSFQGNIRQALHHVAFTVSSIMTTTGFSTVDFDVWPEFSRTLLCILMIFGACAGSTAGGIKIARLLLLGKHLGYKIRQMVRPRSVHVVRMNGRAINEEVLDGVDVYMSAYCAILGISVLLISLENCSMDTNLTAVLACLNNIGPGLGLVGPTCNYGHFSALSKLLLSLDMLIGRLEIFPILILFSPQTWKRTR